MIIMLDKTHSDFPPSSFLFRLANKVASAIPHKGPSANPMAWLSHNPQPFNATPKRSPSDKPIAICCTVTITFFFRPLRTHSCTDDRYCQPSKNPWQCRQHKILYHVLPPNEIKSCNCESTKKDINPFLILIVQNETWQI